MMWFDIATKHIYRYNDSFAQLDNCDSTFDKFYQFGVNLV